MTGNKLGNGMRMRYRVLILWVLVLLWEGVSGQAGAQGAESGAAISAPLLLPMETVNGHFVVVLEDRSLGKLRFVVDTGAETTLLSTRAATKAKVNRHFSDRFYSFYGFGQGKKARLKGHTKLELGSGQRTLATVDAFVADIGVLATIAKPAADGILGWDFFQHVCVRLDPKGKQMAIGPAAHCSTIEDGFYAPPVRWLDQGLLIPVKITLANGRALKLKLHVDTGSDSISLNPRLRRDLGLEEKPQGKAENWASGMNGSYPWDLVYAASVEAVGGHPAISGNFPIMVPRAGGYSQPNWLFGGKNEALLAHDGVVGTNMLDRFEMIFDPVQKKLYTRADNYVTK